MMLFYTRYEIILRLKMKLKCKKLVAAISLQGLYSVTQLLSYYKFFQKLYVNCCDYSDYIRSRYCTGLI